MTYRNTILSETSLLHYWPMDESSGSTLYDIKGTSNITFYGATLGQIGKIDGTAVSFDGSNDGGQTAAINLTAYNKIVMEAIVNFPNFNNTDDMALEFGDSYGNNGSFHWDANCSDPTGKMLAYTYGNVGLNSVAYDRPSTNVWHHVVLIYDFTQAVNEVSYYCDGLLVSKSSAPSPINNTGNFGNLNLNIACRNLASLFCEVKIQHLAMYSNITEMQIRRHYLDTFCTEHAVVNSELWDNAYLSSETPRQSNGARFVFDTDSDFICVRGTTDLYAYFATLSELIVNVDGVYNSELQLTSAAQQDFEINLGSLGTIKRVEIINGLQSTGGTSSVKGSYIDSVFYKTGQSFSLVSEPTSNRFLFYGDSITAGGNCAHPTRDGYAFLLRSTDDIATDAWGYRTLYDDASSSGLITSLVTKFLNVNPKYIYMAIGTVDYSASKWTPAAFGAAYAAVLDEIYLQVPSVKVICQSPIKRGDEGTLNALGHDATEYRDAIYIACIGRSWATYFEGFTILVTGDLADGVHPTEAGHVKYAAAVRARLASFAAVGNTKTGNRNLVIYHKQ